MLVNPMAVNVDSQLGFHGSEQLHYAQGVLLEIGPQTHRRLQLLRRRAELFGPGTSVDRRRRRSSQTLGRSRRIRPTPAP